MTPKDKLVGINVTPDEHNALKALAKKHKKSLSAWGRDVLLKNLVAYDEMIAAVPPAASGSGISDRTTEEGASRGTSSMSSKALPRSAEQERPGPEAAGVNTQQFERALEQAEQSRERAESAPKPPSTAQVAGRTGLPVKTAERLTRGKTVTIENGVVLLDGKPL